jgi:hypothetical protein
VVITSSFFTFGQSEKTLSSSAVCRGWNFAFSIPVGSNFSHILLKARTKPYGLVAGHAAFTNKANIINKF